MLPLLIGKQLAKQIIFKGKTTFFKIILKENYPRALFFFRMSYVLKKIKGKHKKWRKRGGWLQSTNIFITDSELGSVIANKINIERDYFLPKSVNILQRLRTN